ncbi:uncharacterized protein L3040_008888 [Drepanopeziza brunnea f. sp. 'multigermtubi']|uniref:uncharacterized protein n=1 Tax=Drepanopeziza brunnea f. sp. 'multigermtubi' TaxID=698441 RepID=UPI0023846215|nr:hypothetical protein L3040_008888 [Drepanopeziza brunnea f. sp. 'multigermtubi']
MLLCALLGLFYGLRGLTNPQINFSLRTITQILTRNGESWVPVLGLEEFRRYMYGGSHWCKVPMGFRTMK